MSVGEFAPYLIRVENLSPFELNDVLISDLVPAGFELVEESIRLLRAGNDGQLETEDDDISSLSSSGNRPIEFEVIRLSGNETLQISYVLRVGSGVPRACMSIRSRRR